MRNNRFLLLTVILGFLFQGTMMAEEIHDAARDGDLAKVEALLAKDPELVHAKGSNEKVPLHFAAERDEQKIVKYLLQHKAQVDARNVAGETPLHYAVGWGYQDMIKLLLDHGAAINSQTNNGDTLLHYTRFRGFGEVAALLIAHGADINKKNNEGVSVLEQAAGLGQDGVVEVLLKHKAEVNIAGEKGPSLLLAAVRMGNQGFIELLLKKGVDVDEKSEAGINILHAAAIGSNQKMVDMILSQGGDMHSPNQNGGNLLHSAIRGNLIDLAQKLIKTGVAVNTQNELGRTPLHLAVNLAQLDMVKFLVQNGAELDHKDKLGRTSLHMASDWGDQEISDFLRSQGAKDIARPSIQLNRGTAQEEVAEVEVSYIANEGFMISSGKKKVLVDALFENPFGYLDTPKRVFNRMLKRQAPFDHIDLLLYSHAHRDHFEPKMTNRFLLAHPETVLLGNNVVFAEMEQEAAGRYEQVKKQGRNLNPAWGTILSEKINGISIKIFAVNHAGPGREPYVTLAYLFDMDGIKVLHLGDIAPPSSIDFFRKLGLEKEEIDIAFVDPFFLQDEDGQEIIRKYMHPEKFILMHLRPGEEVRYSQELSAMYDNIITFSDPMEKKLFKK